MSRYCLDTSAYAYFKRGDERVVDLLDSADWIGVPSVTLGELFLGFFLGERLNRNLAELEEFLANPSVHELDVDRSAAQVYAEIVAAQRKAGTPLPTNDLWIAATAATAGATVLTYDEHFRRIGRVGSLILPPPAR